ncbi:MAG: hypothetical protein A3J37_03800 [Alphaproteobacteria bacterium RIFCSPHIGHO2_12_FULL_45_9]|nr:MAG: hypothetical protein A3B66_03955 [Alphaproteobacteria bacterium RIFCSPHIGHO2_02_FULL_46_13]OFW94101.1 MAG: hypothetical protein A3J37_03800 [Alphaproteobacteria bacterium RIFCSPHIGHO2_12_FULL_45_9]
MEMKNTSFDKPSSFAPHFIVNLEKPLSLFGGYLTIGMFFLFGIMLFMIGKYDVAALSIGAMLLMYASIFHHKRMINERVIIAASTEGIYLQPFNLYVPFECVEGVFEETERLRGYTIVSLKLYFYVPYGQLGYLRKKLIWRFSWPSLLRQESERCLVQIGIPYTVGKGQPLSYSKQEIAETLNMMAANYKN